MVIIISTPDSVPRLQWVPHRAHSRNRIKGASPERARREDLGQRDRNRKFSSETMNDDRAFLQTVEMVVASWSVSTQEQTIAIA